MQIQVACEINVIKIDGRLKVITTIFDKYKKPPVSS